MIRKSLLLVFICTLFSSLPGNCQLQSSESVVLVHSKRFRAGDMYYASSVRGLQMFMSDLRSENPELYDLLSPEFNAIKRNRDAAYATMIAAGIIGTTLLVSAFTFGMEDMHTPGMHYTDSRMKEPNKGMVFAALGVYIAGGLAARLLYPGEERIYNFLNLHNRNSPNRKLDWEIGLNVFENMEPGLKLSMKF
jgi:hypothetical protein